MFASRNEMKLEDEIRQDKGFKSQQQKAMVNIFTPKAGYVIVFLKLSSPRPYQSAIQRIAYS